MCSRSEGGGGAGREAEWEGRLWGLGREREARGKACFRVLLVRLRDKKPELREKIFLGSCIKKIPPVCEPNPDDILCHPSCTPPDAYLSLRRPPFLPVVPPGPHSPPSNPSTPPCPIPERCGANLTRSTSRLRPSTALASPPATTSWVRGTRAERRRGQHIVQRGGRCGGSLTSLISTPRPTTAGA